MWDGASSSVASRKEGWRLAFEGVSGWLRTRVLANGFRPSDIVCKTFWTDLFGSVHISFRKLGLSGEVVRSRLRG